uniref:BLTX568 n=1 Tax=Nephila pilipes TaxID=299642 RepID=A0A076L2R7_NEPPI|nr:BLTX568 [Nephila pilipes]
MSQQRVCDVILC